MCVYVLNKFLGSNFPCAFSFERFGFYCLEYNGIAKYVILIKYVSLYITKCEVYNLCEDDYFCCHVEVGVLVMHRMFKF